MYSSCKALRFAVALAATVPAPAFAADLILTKAPLLRAVAPMPQPWSGFHIGGTIGYGWIDPTASFAAAPAPAGGGLVNELGVGAPVNFDMVGALGGLHIGYDRQIGQDWLIGAEADFDFGRVHGSGSADNITPIAYPFNSTADEQIEWFGTLRGRLGILAASDMLIYATGGWAYGGVKQSVSYINDGAAPVADQDGTCSIGSGGCYAGATSHNASGWTAGGGFEYALADHWSMRAEYLYVDLGSAAFSESVARSNTPGIGPSTILVRFSPSTLQVVRTGVSYRF